MKKIIVILLVVLAASGCVKKYYNSPNDANRRPDGYSHGNSGHDYNRDRPHGAWKDGHDYRGRPNQNWNRGR